MALSTDRIMQELDRIQLPDGGSLVSRNMVKALTAEAGQVRFVIEAANPDEARKMEAIRAAAVQIVGVQPTEGSSIPGIRRWPKEYLPSIFEAARVDRQIDVDQREAEDTTRALAVREGIFAGVSSGGAVAAALRVAREVENAVVVAIICDRGDRYLSSGIFPG